MKPIHERRRRSARETFSNCAHRYHAEYIAEVESGNSVTRRGSTWHLARELYIGDLWSARLTDDFELARGAMSRAMKALPLPFAEELDCRDLWKRWIERFRLPIAEFFSCEARDLFAFGAQMRFDLVLVPSPDTLRINDAKTNWSIPSQDILDAHFQPAMYLAAARRLFPGFSRYEFEWDFIRFNQQRITMKTPAELDDVEDTLSDQDEAMSKAEESGVFGATGGSHCGTCVCRDCPVVGNALRYSPVMAGLPEAAKTVGEIAALHRAIELRQSALRAYCDDHGAVQGGGIEWAHRAVTHNRYPAAGVLAVLNDAGVTFPLYFNGTAVKPLTTSKRKYTAIEQQIKDLAVPTTKTEFRPKTVVEQEEREYQEVEE